MTFGIETAIAAITTALGQVGGAAVGFLQMVIDFLTSLLGVA